MSPGGQPPRDHRSSRWLAGVLLVAALFLGYYLLRGWYPHDEGMLGQAAERVLGGEMPHRDFDDPYTGLLTYVHAAAFAIGGIRLPVLRIPLFVGTLLWLVAVFRIARRSTGPAAAAAITLTALAWSVPNYPASVPSWYNLFLATAGTAALLAWHDDRRSRWLLLAGLAGGVSFLLKLTGLFFLAGGLLYLVYATQPEAPPASGARRSPGAALLISVGLGLLVLVLWRAIAPWYWPRVVYHFVVPGAVLAGALGVREWTGADRTFRGRIGSLAGPGLVFLSGALLPVGIYAALYAWNGALPALVQGVFVAPFRRLAFANMRPPAPFWLLASVPLALLLRPRPDWSDPKWRKTGAGVAAVLVVVGVLAATGSFPHRVVWQSVRGLVPVVTALAGLIVVRPQLAASWSIAPSRTFLPLAMITAFASLVQFPFSSPVYFLYVAPLLLLSVVALVRSIGRTPPSLAGATLLFYGLFAAALVVPGAMTSLGFRLTVSPTAELSLPRGGLRVSPEDALLYQSLIPRLQAVAGARPIWAGPDAPEVYFLGGFRNRSRAIFDFLGTEGAEADDFASRLERDGVGAVVVNTRPPFSAPLDPVVLAALRRRFPQGESVGRFELRWRR